MQNQNFYTYTVLAITLASLSIISFHQLETYSGITAGILALTSLTTTKLALQHGKNRVKNNKLKITAIILPLLYELVLLAGINLSTTIPRYLAITSLVAVLGTEVIKTSLAKELRKTIKPFIGQETRVLILSTGLILSELNVFYIVYAVALVTIASIYDTLEITYKQLN